MKLIHNNDETYNKHYLIKMEKKIFLQNHYLRNENRSLYTKWWSNPNGADEIQQEIIKIVTISKCPAEIITIGLEHCSNFALTLTHNLNLSNWQRNFNLTSLPLTYTYLFYSIRARLNKWEIIYRLNIDYKEICYDDLYTWP